MIGLIGAMPEEVDHLCGGLVGVTTQTIGRRAYHAGRLHGREVCAAFSRWGKVAAASTATTMIERFGVSEIIFTGVAGGIDPCLRVGDIVVAGELFQHDLDASPLFPRLEVPLLGTAGFRPDADRVRHATRACTDFLGDLARHVAPEDLAALGVSAPRVYHGPVASGDRFIAGHEDATCIAERVPGVLCVEMEGAAVAQVAFEHGVPFTVIRVISDAAGEGAELDFHRFVERVASRYTAGIVRTLLR